MIKQLTLATFIISIGLIWLTGGWQSAAAFKESDRLSSTILLTDPQVISNPETTGPIFLAESQRTEAQALPTATPTATSNGTETFSSENSASTKTEEASSSFFESVGPLKLIAGILLILAIVGVALAVIFMAAHKYSEWLNREMPQPVYTQEKQLLQVIENSVKAIIHQAMDRERATGQDRTVEIGLLEFERTSNGGVNLKLNADIAFQPDSNGNLFRQLQTWLIEADRWGRIQKMSQDGVPRYITIEKILVSEMPDIGNGSKNGNGQIEPPKNRHLLTSGENDGGDSYMTQSDTCISITSRRSYLSR